MKLEKDKSTEITVIKNSPAEMIQMAVSSGADLEKLEKLLALQERWEATEARKAYNKAMTAFKADPPRIEKDKKVAFLNTKYSHASLANVTQSINDGLSKHGLSSSWKVVQVNNVISVTCKITHEQGHSEETTLTAPADTSGSKNAIQAIGSAVSYLQRYSLLSVTGLAAHDMDDDGKAAPTEIISAEEYKGLSGSIIELGIDLAKFLEYLKIEKLEDMPKSDLNKARIAIENVKARKVKSK